MSIIKIKKMKFELYTVCAQLYIIPTFKITYDLYLNGSYEIHFTWLNFGAVVIFNQKKW